MGRAGRRRRIAAWVLGPVGLVLAVGSVALATTGYTTATVSSEAMEPTYSPGQRVLFERIDGDEVRRGDVVLIEAPDRFHGGLVLKRVLGTAGDRVAERTGAPVTVNGKELSEPYVRNGDPSGGAPPFDVTVPKGRLFLVGDNRGNSVDSRYFLTEQSGTFPEGVVRARVLEDRTGPAGLGLAALLGFALAITGLVLGITARFARQRERDPAMTATGHAPWGLPPRP
jgi:signal peptidase I